VLNRIILIGRLTRDPELRYTPNGVARATFSLAVDRPFTNSRGERETDFINIVAWRQLGELCANYLKKGRLAAVEGRLEIRSYDNQEGQRVRVSEVIADNVRFLDSASGASGQNRPERMNNYENNRFDQDPFANDGPAIDISDDDLPF
jgi:single-strand DNA-binding protein